MYTNVNNVVMLPLSSYEKVVVNSPFKITSLWSDGELITFKVEEAGDEQVSKL